MKLINRRYADALAKHSSLKIAGVLPDSNYPDVDTIARKNTSAFLSRKNFCKKDEFIIRRPRWPRDNNRTRKNINSIHFAPSPDPEVEINTYRSWHPYFASLSPEKLFSVLDKNKYLSRVYDMGQKHGETVFESQQWIQYFGLEYSSRPKNKPVKQRIHRFVRALVAYVFFFAYQCFPVQILFGMQSTHNSEVTVSVKNARTPGGEPNVEVVLENAVNPAQWTYILHTDASGLAQSNIHTDVKDDVISPKSFDLRQNYPNPFNPSTNIPLQLDKPSDVNISIFNIIGQKIASIDEKLNTGSYTINWEPNNQSSGVYFLNASTNGERETIKMILMDGNSSGRGLSISNGGNYINNNAKNHSLQKSLSDGEEIYHIFLRKDGFKTKVDSNVVITDGILLEYDLVPQDMTTINLQENDTDSNIPGKINIDGTEYEVNDGVLDIDLEHNQNHVIKGQRFLEDGTPFSFIRTIQYKPNNDGFNLDLKVVDFYLRDVNKDIVDSLYVQGHSPASDSTKMTPERFKGHASGTVFNYYRDGRMFKWDSENSLPDSIIIGTDNHNYGGFDCHMTDYTLNGIIDILNEYAFPYLETEIPIRVVENSDSLFAADGWRKNIVYCFPRGPPANGDVGFDVDYNSINPNNPESYKLNSCMIHIRGPPTNDLEWDVLKSTVLQEFMTAFGLSNPAPNEYTRDDESIVDDQTTRRDLSLYDVKDYRIYITFPIGTHKDDVFGLDQ